MSVLDEDLELLSQSDLPFEQFRGKSILITGATGLIGSLLVRNLLYCNRVHKLEMKIYALIRSREKADAIFGGSVDLSNLVYIIADIEKDELDEKISTIGHCDFIIHAAAVTASKLMVAKPVDTIKTAVNGTEKLLQFAVNKKCESFVYISSMEIYGQPFTDGKTTEKDLGYVDISTVRSCYPEGKRMCECLCTAYASQYALNVKSARLAQTFGPGILPTENRVFAQFARSVMAGEDIVLHTQGTSEGNYVYTRDAIKAILLLLIQGEAGQAYNVANEKNHMTIRQMAELVAKDISDRNIHVVIDVPKDNQALGYAPDVRLWLDSSKMRALGWEPEVDLAESYRRMLRWMER